MQKEAEKPFSFPRVEKLTAIAARTMINLFQGNHCTLINSLPTLKPEIALLIAQQKDITGNTLLHTAAYLGDLGVVSYLLSLGIDKRPRNKWKQTPLLVAANQGHIGICRLLYTPEDRMESEDCKKLLKYVLANKGEDSVAFAQFIGLNDDESIIPAIAAGGNLQLLETVLNGCAEKIEPCIIQQALINAIRAGSFDFVNILKGHDCDDEDDFMLYEATLYRQTRIACLLLERGLICSEALHCAVRQGDKKLVKIYLKKFPVQLNSLDEMAKTPLYYAASYGFFDLVEKLLKRGAQVNVEGEYHSALYGALFNKQYAVVKLLIEVGALLNCLEVEDQDTLIGIRSDSILATLMAFQVQLRSFDEALSTMVNCGSLNINDNP